MSWLFGLDKNQQGFQAPQVPTFGESGQGESNEGGPASGSGSGGGSNGSIGSDAEGYRSAAYSFDSTALERAAKAAKDLEKSKHASEALALSRVQEETKQKEQEVQVKQYEAQIEQMKIEQKRVEGEQRRKNMEEEAKNSRYNAEYQDKLARQRYEDQLIQQKRSQEENLAKQEESVAKQEAMRR